MKLFKFGVIKDVYCEFRIKIFYKFIVNLYIEKLVCRL